MDILIDALPRQWNHGLIDGIFSSQEANLIKKIPLARVEFDDSIFWPLAKNGCYTCKLGYRFLKEEAELYDHGGYQNHEKDLWKGIWSLHLPNMVKNLFGESLSKFAAY